MQEIWKFVLAPNVPLYMPRGAEVLSVAQQRGRVNLWAAVNPAMEQEQRLFEMYGTGHEIPSDLDLAFIGTVLLMDDRVVIHVFENITKNITTYN